MNQLVFGEKPTNFRYTVIVCPKCRQHAQILEAGKNTLKCQRCGTILQARKLRIFFSSEELADAVDFRTRLQSEISEKGCETFSLETSAKDFKLSRNIVPENLPPKKDQKSILLDLLDSAGGKMRIEEFRQKAMEKGIGPEKFDLMLKILLETGELYSPKPGIIRLLQN